MEPEVLDGLLFTKMDTVRGRKKRTRGAKKRGAGDVATALTSDSAFQRAGLSHGQEKPKPPGTPSTGFIQGFQEVRGKK